MTKKRSPTKNMRLSNLAGILTDEEGARLESAIAAGRALSRKRQTYMDAMLKGH